MSERSPALSTLGSEPGLDVRADFPVLHQDINGKPLAYLDSAASGQAPAAVIEAVAAYQRHDHANVHRGVHTLSHRATEDGPHLIRVFGARGRRVFLPVAMGLPLFGLIVRNKIQ